MFLQNFNVMFKGEYGISAESDYSWQVTLMTSDSYALPGSGILTDWAPGNPNSAFSYLPLPQNLTISVDITT